MSSSKRPSTSSLRRFITSRPYVPVAEIRRRFGLDDPDCICSIARNGTVAFVGLPEREALKLQDLWSRDEIGVELSVEVRAPVVVGVYPMRIARYVMDGNGNGFQANGHGASNAHGGNGRHRDHGPANGTGQHEQAPAPAEPLQHGNTAGH
jgi:hypothetical protein